MAKKSPFIRRYAKRTFYIINYVTTFSTLDSKYYNQKFSLFILDKAEHCVEERDT